MGLHMQIPEHLLGGGGRSGLNFGHPKAEVFHFWGQGWGGGLSALKFQRGLSGDFGHSRLPVHHRYRLSHTTYVETNEDIKMFFFNR